MLISQRIARDVHLLKTPKHCNVDTGELRLKIIKAKKYLVPSDLMNLIWDIQENVENIEDTIYKFFDENKLLNKRKYNIYKHHIRMSEPTVFIENNTGGVLVEWINTDKYLITAIPSYRNDVRLQPWQVLADKSTLDITGEINREIIKNGYNYECKCKCCDPVENGTIEKITKLLMGVCTKTLSSLFFIGLGSRPGDISTVIEYNLNRKELDLIPKPLQEHYNYTLIDEFADVHNYNKTFIANGPITLKVIEKFILGDHEIRLDRKKFIGNLFKLDIDSFSENITANERMKIINPKWTKEEYLLLAKKAAELYSIGEIKGWYNIVVSAQYMVLQTKRQRQDISIRGKITTYVQKLALGLIGPNKTLEPIKSIVNVTEPVAQVDEIISDQPIAKQINEITPETQLVVDEQVIVSIPAEEVKVIAKPVERYHKTSNLYNDFSKSLYDVPSDVVKEEPIIQTPSIVSNKIEIAMNDFDFDATLRKHIDEQLLVYEKQYMEIMNDKINSEVDIKIAEITERLNSLAKAQVERKIQRKLNAIKNKETINEEVNFKVMVVGLHSDQEQFIKKEFNSCLKLVFIHTDAPSKSLINVKDSCDFVLMMTKFINHNKFDIAKDHKGLIMINGGMSDLKDKLYEIACA